MTPTAAQTFVLWTVAAQRQLQQALAGAVCARRPNTLRNTMTNLTNHLRLLFPNAGIFQQQFTGFRPRDDEFILLVEVDDLARPGRHIVKLAFTEQGQVNASRLRRELEAWESCRPHGLRHDLVFMTLEPLPATGPRVGLLYGDAQQFLGVPTATSLENAFLAAVCHDAPSARLGRPGPRPALRAYRPFAVSTILYRRPGRGRLRPPRASPGRQSGRLAGGGPPRQRWPARTSTPGRRPDAASSATRSIRRAAGKNLPSPLYSGERGWG